MKQKLKVLGVVGVVVFAFSAIAVASASAANFLASESGTLKGHALGTQVFTVNAGEVRCNTAATAGNAEEVGSEDETVTVSYSSCIGFGFIGISVTPAELDLHANGTIDLLNTITVTVPFPACTVKFGPQNGLGSVNYENNSGKVIAKSAVSGFSYTASSGVCGSSGTNGTYVGNNEIELNEGSGFLQVVEEFEIKKIVSINGVVQKPGECKLGKEGETCKIELKVLKGEVKVEGNEWRGAAEPEKRYKVTVGCTKKLLLKAVQSCTDEIEMTKKVMGTENQWCILLAPVGFQALKSCTVVKPV